MEKRGFIFSTSSTSMTEVYNTADINGVGSTDHPDYRGWTLTSWELSEPELLENYINVPGRLDGPIDASTALTDGDPRYGSRNLTATFEMSDFDRAERELLIRSMRNELDGYRRNIEPPDSPGYYLTGRVRVEKLYNDLAHASVRVTAVCEPWFYSNEEKEVNLTAKANEVQSQNITNNGRRLIIPTIAIVGGSVGLSGEGGGGLILSPHTLPSTSRSDGTYQLPDFYILPWETFTLKYSGTGTIKLTYREATL